jgi:hypothetical protein
LGAILGKVRWGAGWRRYGEPGGEIARLLRDDGRRELGIRISDAEVALILPRRNGRARGAPGGQ